MCSFLSSFTLLTSQCVSLKFSEKSIENIPASEIYESLSLKKAENSVQLNIKIKTKQNSDHKFNQFKDNTAITKKNFETNKTTFK